MKLRIYKYSNRWTWEIVAGNNKVVGLAAELYSTRRKARKTAWKVWHDFTAGLVRVEEEEV